MSYPDLYLLMKFILGLAASAMLGSLLVYLIKKALIDPSIRLGPDLAGMVERPLVTLFVAIGGAYLYFIPVVIIAKLFFMLAAVSGTSNILARSEPAMAFQKIRTKGSLAVDMIASPLIAILAGLALIWAVGAA